MSRTRERDYKRYFQALNDELHEADPGFPKGPVSGRSFCNFAPGASWGCYTNFFSTRNRVGVCIYLGLRNREMNKVAFDGLWDQREVIEREFGEALEWKRLDNKIASRMDLYREARIEDSDERLAEIRAWAIPRLLNLKRVFGPRLR